VVEVAVEVEVVVEGSVQEAVSWVSAQPENWKMCCLRRHRQ
jgi:hypothetical protein